MMKKREVGHMKVQLFKKKERKRVGHMKVQVFFFKKRRDSPWTKKEKWRER